MRNGRNVESAYFSTEHTPIITLKGRFMPNITYIEDDGGTFTHDVPIGNSVMEGAIDNGVKGIVAACGGCMSCASCHCYIEPAWQARVGLPGEDEDDVLDSAKCRKINSRLSCQIEVTAELDGLTVRLPKSQY
jgi:2Fe-2S ferredoxin